MWSSGVMVPLGPCYYSWHAQPASPISTVSLLNLKPQQGERESVIYISFFKSRHSQRSNRHDTRWLALDLSGSFHV